MQKKTHKSIETKQKEWNSKCHYNAVSGSVKCCSFTERECSIPANKIGINRNLDRRLFHRKCPKRMKNEGIPQ